MQSLRSFRASSSAIYRDYVLLSGRVMYAVSPVLDSARKPMAPLDENVYGRGQASLSPLVVPEEVCFTL